MARFHFDLCSGDDVLFDHEGRDVSAAHPIARAALIEARAIIASEAIEGRIDLDQHLRIEDANGRVVHRLRFVDAVDLVLPVKC